MEVAASPARVKKTPNSRYGQTGTGKSHTMGVLETKPAAEGPGGGPGGKQPFNVVSTTIPRVWACSSRFVQERAKLAEI